MKMAGLVEDFKIGAGTALVDGLWTEPVDQLKEDTLVKRKGKRV